MDARSDEVRHTCPQCGDILVAGCEDALIQQVVEHAQRLHDHNVFDLVPPNELRARIRRENELYWSHIRHLLPNEVTSIIDAKLGGREREVVGCIVHGFSNREIAKRLCISERTVSTHLVNIYEKLGVHSRSALVAMVRAADRNVEANLHSASGPGLGPFIRP